MHTSSSSQRFNVTAITIACVFALQVPLCLAGDSTTQFDLPAESLDKALRDFAIQTHCQISYEPAMVAGIQAPQIHGEYTPSAVLSMLLKNTKLRAVNVSEDMIQVVAVSSTTAQVAAPEGGAVSSEGIRVVRVGYTREAPSDGSISDDPDSKADQSDQTKKKYTKKNDDDLTELVVTGTYIRGVSPASPLINIDREQIDRSGFTSIADVMLSIPQNFGGGYNASNVAGNNFVNSSYGSNPAGASVPNLRGLGPGSTLTLVDGHRMAAGLTAGGSDIGSIPIDAIDHIEVLADSASAAYGSDAVAGVVNVILKRNYDGARTSVAYGEASQGGGQEKRASQLFGKSWNTGNMVASYEYTQQGAVFATERGFTQSAPRPYSILPSTKSNAVTLSATQALSQNISVYVDALYVDRDSDQFLNNPGFPAAIDYAGSLSRYSVVGGMNADLPGDWKATLFLDVAQDHTFQNAFFLTTPLTSPAETQDLGGTMRNVEINTNGPIGTLPTGPLRLAAGVGYRHEGFTYTGTSEGGPVNVDSDSSRNIGYAFGELSIPVVEHSQRPWLNYIDLSLSARYERYSDFGSKTEPKIGIAYGPSNQVKLRSTWGKAFRAPNLDDLNETPNLSLEDVSNPAAPTGSSVVFFRGGGNPGLKPETAEAWTLGLDYSPTAFGGLDLSGTLFDIKYTNRITEIVNPYTAFTDPSDAYFVTNSPSPQDVQSLYSSYPSTQIYNYSSSSYSPGTVAAIIDTRYVNVASQTARGADLLLNYRVDRSPYVTQVFLNGTYLDLTQKNTPESSVETLSGLTFYPPKWRMRGGATWTFHGLAVTGTVNYLAAEINNQVTPVQRVGSWTTFDTSIRYSIPAFRSIGGLAVNLAAINLFNRNPPYVALPPILPVGINYDANNTSPLGRFVRLQISKDW